MAKIRLETLTAETLPMAVEITVECFSQSYGLVYIDYKDFLSGETQHDIKLRPFLIFADDQPIGTIGLYEMPKHPRDIWVHSFVILPKFRGKGFGREALHQIIELAKHDKTKDTLRLWTYSVWNAAAQPLYEKHMHLRETYTHPDDNQHDIKEGKPFVYSYSLSGKTPKPWGNKFLDLDIENRYQTEGHELLIKDGFCLTRIKR